MSQEEEMKNRRIGWGISIGFHALLVALFFLILAWREPDPPVPEYGIELNFGMEDVGSGDIQPALQSSPVEQIEETIPEETEAPAEESAPPQPVEKEILQDEHIQEEVQTQEEPSDVQAEPMASVKKSEEVPEKVNDEQPVKAEPENTAINQAEDIKGTPDEEKATEETISQGDNAGKTGDKGNPQGDIDSRALYGSQGGGGGPKLELAGWMWDEAPKPEDTSNENGRIIFQIKINDRGEVISVITQEKAVSPEIERIYKRVVESLTFHQLSHKTMPAPVSAGKITFIIRAK